VTYWSCVDKDYYQHNQDYDDNSSNNVPFVEFPNNELESFPGGGKPQE
jgi:hypothetical protein